MAKNGKTAKKWTLAKAQAENPHKQGAGWDKQAASELSQEFTQKWLAKATAAEKAAVTKFLSGATEYVAVAGWKGPIKHVALALGVIKTLGRDE